MRALIIVSASRGDGHRAFQDLGDEFLHQVLAAFLGGGFCAETPFFDDLIEQACVRRICSVCPAVARLCGSAIGFPSRSHLALQLVQLFVVADGVEQQFLELVVALQAAAQIGETGAEVQQFLQRLHLPGDVLRLEVVHALEMQVHFQIRRRPALR